MPRPHIVVRHRSWSTIALVAGLLSLAAGCAESVDSDPSAALAETPLVPADGEALVDYLSMAAAQHPPPDLLPLVPPDFGSTPAPADESSPTEYSTTTLQTKGVGEPDLVKFDGESLFVTRQGQGRLLFHAPQAAVAAAPLRPISSFPYETPAAITVYDTADDPAEANEIASIKLRTALEVHGLMLLPPAGDEPPVLVVIGTDNSHFTIRSDLFGDPIVVWHEGSVSLWTFDVSDPNEPVITHRSRIEGILLAARRIGDELVLITRTRPRVPSTFIDAPETARDELDVQSLLPRRWVYEPEELAPRPMVQPEDCFVPRARANADREAYYSPTLMTISSVDLRAPAEPVSICAAGPADRIFSSTRALYLASTHWNAAQHTVIHKFAYTDRGPEFRGSGWARGVPAGTNPAFGLGEIGDAFGIVTAVHERTSGGRFDPRPRLTVLRESDEVDLVLEELSHLPNEAEPDPIGKPGEQLHAVRYFGDRIYAVTFRRIDPLYVIDVGDPHAPFIAGELEVPGFSDILQPLGSDLLLGIGQDSIEFDGQDYLQGVKVELFDVSDPSEPVSVDSISIGQLGSTTTARHDHHALTTLDMGDGTTRVAVPVQLHENAEGGAGMDPRVPSPWVRTGLHLFEVDLETPAIDAVGEVVVAEAADENPASGTWNDRSRLQGDAVHYVHDERVWSANWYAPEDVVGAQ